MSADNAPAPDREAAGPDRGGAREPGGAADDGAGPRPDDRLFGAAGARDAGAGDDDPAESWAAASRTYREARSTFNLHDSSGYVSTGSIGTFSIHVGPPARVLAGPVAAEELTTLRDTLHEPPGYAEFKSRLRADRLIVLLGRSGTGRMFTALSLLDDLSRGSVARLDPATDLKELEAEHLTAGRGFALEPDTFPGELELDRLRGILEHREAYGVLLAVPEDGHAPAAVGRYRLTFRPAGADEVLDSQLRYALADRPDLVEEARGLARSEDVTTALGLGELLPAEATRLAGLLARRVTGDLPQEELLDECRDFALRQAAVWFANGERAEELPRLRDSALRVSLAVLGHASVSAVIEAAELLTWEFAVTTDPDNAPGRPLFSQDLDARLVAARAVTEAGTEALGDEDVPVGTVRFAGERLAPAVLEHLWQYRHNVRGPVLRWLSSLCDDPRAQVWVRAALAAGALCRFDCSHTVQHILQPMAAASQARRRLFAATALDLALTDPHVGPAVAALVRRWAMEGSAGLRRTAAVVLGRGRAAESVARALDLLGTVGTWQEGEARVDAAQNIVQLMGSTVAPLPMRRVRGWLGDARPEYQNLGLQSTLFLAGTRVDEVWNPAPEIAHLGEVPLLVALAEARPEHASGLAGLLWTALNTARSYESALETVEDWFTRSAGRPWAAALLRLLRHLLHTEDDKKRLLSLIHELTQDPYQPLAQDHARLLRRAVQGEGTR
ncbi:hypothetical protein [Streptomyces synnematoformans]|uniref:HEAT repeat domain-containing protein n=1 Tax=Streptomyces synnematoformans TaxID=415721 RepID=A0ABN2Z4R6_9ACTN